MAKNTIPRGETSVIRHVFIQDSSSTVGAGKTGLAFNSGSLTAYYLFPGGTATSLTLEDITTLGTYAAPTSNAHIRFKEVSSTNMPGWYELHFHNDWFSVANGRKAAELVLKGASGMVQLNLEIDCIGMEIQSAAPSVTATEVTNARSKYALGAVWIGPTANTNTVNYTDGIITNPVSTIAAAKTIADSLKLRRFQVVRTGSVTIAATMSGYQFDGDRWPLTTSGSQDVGASYFRNATISAGTFASTSGSVTFENCDFIGTISVEQATFINCTFDATLTLNAAGTYVFINCSNGYQHGGITLVCPATGTTFINMQRWTGNLTINGIISSVFMEVNEAASTTIQLNGAGGSATISGMIGAFTDSRTGSPTLDTTGAIIGQQVDVYKSQGRGAMGTGTVTTGASTTSVPTSACSPAGSVADQFKDRVMIFATDTATAALRGVAKGITASTNAANPTFTVGTLPATPASGDKFIIV